MYFYNNIIVVDNLNIKFSIFIIEVLFEYDKNVLYQIEDYANKLIILLIIFVVSKI